jgi:hypothetical protein
MLDPLVDFKATQAHTAVFDTDDGGVVELRQSQLLVSCHKAGHHERAAELSRVDLTHGEATAEFTLCAPLSAWDDTTLFMQELDFDFHFIT